MLQRGEGGGTREVVADIQTYQTQRDAGRVAGDWGMRADHTEVHRTKVNVGHAANG